MKAQKITAYKVEGLIFETKERAVLYCKQLAYNKVFDKYCYKLKELELKSHNWESWFKQRYKLCKILTNAIEDEKKELDSYLNELKE